MTEKRIFKKNLDEFALENEPNSPRVAHVLALLLITQRKPIPEPVQQKVLDFAEHGDNEIKVNFSAWNQSITDGSAEGLTIFAAIKLAKSMINSYGPMDDFSQISKKVHLTKAFHLACTQILDQS